MKTILIAAGLALLNVPAPAQTASRTNPSAAAGLGKAGASDNEAMNIRAYIELLRSDVKKSKSEIMGDIMQLDADDAAKFWPIYKDFEGELSAVGDKVLAIVKEYVENYTNLTNDVADRLATNALNVEEERNALKRKYYGRMKGSLGAVAAARFLQVENQLERLIDLQISAELPAAPRQ